VWQGQTPVSALVVECAIVQDIRNGVVGLPGCYRNDGKKRCGRGRPACLPSLSNAQSFGISETVWSGYPDVTATMGKNGVTGADPRVCPRFRYRGGGWICSRALSCCSALSFVGFGHDKPILSRCFFFHSTQHLLPLLPPTPSSLRSDPSMLPLEGCYAKRGSSCLHTGRPCFCPFFEHLLVCSDFPFCPSCKGGPCLALLFMVYRSQKIREFWDVVRMTVFLLALIGVHSRLNALLPCCAWLALCYPSKSCDRQSEKLCTCKELFGSLEKILAEKTVNSDR
jgi:hypothetical protein